MTTSTSSRSDGGGEGDGGGPAHRLDSGSRAIRAFDLLADRGGDRLAGSFGVCCASSFFDRDQAQVVDAWRTGARRLFHRHRWRVRPLVRWLALGLRKPRDISRPERAAVARAPGNWIVAPRSASCAG